MIWSEMNGEFCRQMLAKVLQQFNWVESDIYHAICLLAFLTGASSAVWALPAREGVEANDAIIFLSKLHSTLLNIGLHMMHELYNVAMPLDR